MAARLTALDPGLELVEQIIQTEGDLDRIRQFAPGDHGVFVKQIEHALLAEEIDLAVHSLKDLPTTQPAGLELAAFPERHDPRDALLTTDGKTFEKLPGGTRIGTGSPRRRTQLLHARKDVEIVPIRGNVGTRMERVIDGDVDGAILAVAGVERLGLDRLARRPLPVSLCLPAVGQGVLAIEVRTGDDRARRVAAALDDGPTRLAVEAERAFLRRLGGGCLAPATAHAEVAGAQLRLRALVGDGRGDRQVVADEHGEATEGGRLGERLAEQLIEQGALELLARARES